MISDEQLLKGCRKYKSSAQQKLFEKYASVMRGVCIRYVDDTSEAHDIIQESFLKVFSKIKDYKGHGKLESWIRRIVVNTSIDYYNKNKRKPYQTDINNITEQKVNNTMLVSEIDEDFDNDFIEDIQEDEITFDTIVSSDFTHEELLEILKEVPEQFRIIFNLFYIEGVKHQDIAEMLQIEVKTSRTRLFRAKKILQEKLRKKAFIKLRN